MLDPAPTQAPDPDEGLATIQEQAIDEDAAKVVRRLVRHGHEAYLVGGCVRDLMLRRVPKDFDVSTSATPPEIKKLFRNSRIIGRRFRLAHIFFGSNIIETSTFRAPPSAQEGSGEELLIQRDNVFGTAREDALRRDFTVNGLFYDLRRDRVIDHVGGLADLKAHRIRTIGDPRVRIQEDPVRIIRAVKFATRLGFTFDPATEDAIVEFRGLLAKCSVARVLEEIYRLLGSGHATAALRMMQRIGVLAVLLPEIDAVLGRPEDPRLAGRIAPIYDRSGLPRSADSKPQGEPRPRDTGPDRTIQQTRDLTPEEITTILDTIEQLVDRMTDGDPAVVEKAGQMTWPSLEALDRLVNAQQNAEEPPVSHAVLLGATLTGLAWPQLQADRPLREAVPALETMVKTIATRLRVSRKDRERVKQILVAQRRMVHRGKRRRPTALIQRDYFPEAWTLFRISCEASGENQEAFERWQQLLGQQGRGGKKRRKRRRRRPRRRQEKST